MISMVDLRLEPHHCPSPLVMKVVQKEVQKLPNAGVKYLISDSEWVSTVHVVHKKTKITKENNNKGELVLTREQNGLRMCINYMKLNAAT